MTSHFNRFLEARSCLYDETLELSCRACIEKSNFSQGIFLRMTHMLSQHVASLYNTESFFVLFVQWTTWKSKTVAQKLITLAIWMQCQILALVLVLFRNRKRSKRGSCYFDSPSWNFRVQSRPKVNVSFMIKFLFLSNSEKRCKTNVPR